MLWMKVGSLSQNTSQSLSTRPTTKFCKTKSFCFWTMNGFFPEKMTEHEIVKLNTSKMWEMPKK